MFDGEHIFIIEPLVAGGVRFSKKLILWMSSNSKRIISNHHKYRSRFEQCLLVTMASDLHLKRWNRDYLLECCFSVRSCLISCSGFFYFPGLSTQRSFRAPRSYHHLNSTIIPIATAHWAQLCGQQPVFWFIGCGHQGIAPRGNGQHSYLQLRSSHILFWMSFHIPLI